MTKKPHLVGLGNISDSISVFYPITPLPVGLRDVPRQGEMHKDWHQLPSHHRFG